jgi:hypothetical protein
MLNGWISLRVKDPQRVSEWYKQHLHLELLVRSAGFGDKLYTCHIIVPQGIPPNQAQEVITNVLMKDNRVLVANQLLLHENALQYVPN